MTILKPGSVEVIQHWDKNDTNIVVTSTTIKVGSLIDDEGNIQEREFIVISDRQLLVSENPVGGSISKKDYVFLLEQFAKEVRKDFPNKSDEEIKRVAEILVFSVHSTARPHVHIFRGEKGIYSRVKTMGRD